MNIVKLIIPVQKYIGRFSPNTVDFITLDLYSTLVIIIVIIISSSN